MSDVLQKIFSRESWGAQEGRDPTSGQPAYCNDFVTSTQQYATYFYQGNDGRTLEVTVTTGVVDTVTRVCYPASAGDPGTPATPPHNVTRFNIGWDGAAISVDSLAADGQFKFSVDRNSVGVVCGLNDDNIGAGYIEIPFGLYFQSGAVCVIERGQTKSPTVAYITDDRFTITRVAGVIKYFQNSTLLYTSEDASSGVLNADCSLYFGLDNIIDPELLDTVETAFLTTLAQLTGVLDGMRAFLLSGSDAGYMQNDALAQLTGTFGSSYPFAGDITGILDGMSGFMGDSASAGNGELQGVLPGITGDFRNSEYVDCVLTPLTCEFNSSDIGSTISGVLTGMTAYFEAGLLTPNFAAIEGVLTPMASFSIALAGMVGVLTGVLGGMRGFAAAAPPTTSHTIDGILSPMQAFFANVTTAGIPPGVPPAPGTIDPGTGDWEGRSGSQLRAMVGNFLDEETAAGTDGAIDSDLGGLSSFFTNSDGAQIGPGVPPDPTSIDPVTGDWPGRSGDQLSSIVGVFVDATAMAPPAPSDGYIVDGSPPTTSDPVDPLTGDWINRGGSQLRSMVGIFVDDSFDVIVTGGGAGAGVLPMIEAKGSITRDASISSNAILPHPLITTVRFGVKVDAVLPMLTVDAAGTIDNVLDAAVTLPMLTAQGTGTIGTVASAAIILPHPLTTFAQPSWYGANVSLPSVQVVGRIVTDLSLSADIRLPRLQAHGSIGAPTGVLNGHVVLPAIQGGRSAHASILLPMLIVSAHVQNATTGETRIAYAMNLKTGAVTEFTNFAFRAMGRAYNLYWGIGLDGNLYRFGGDLDDTLPIAWEWESGIEDFGSPGQKGVKAVYIDGVFENGATLLVQTDDARRVYSHRAAGNYKNHRQHRILTGKGVRSLNLGFGMANAKGGYLELDRITPEYVIIPRNL